MALCRTPGVVASAGWSRSAYVLAISIPPLGLILGISLSLRSGRRHSMHGAGVIALSITVSIAWIVS